MVQKHNRAFHTDRILVLDDDPDIRLLIAEVAESMNIPCTTASTSEEFLHHFDSDITLILLDLLLPEIDGVEVLRLLANAGCDAGIILVSGVGKRVMETAEKLAQVQNLQIVGQLHKPFRVAELQRMIAGAHELRARPVPDERAARGFELTELQRAISNNELLLHYQPQVHILHRRVVGVEALVRWKHPTLGLIFPDEFIRAMEAAELITELGWAVARQALSEVRQFADSKGNLPLLSINASVRSLQDLEFPDRLMNLVDEAEISPANVVIEITEGGLIEQLSTTLDVLVRLRMKGIQLSIDDFGTGYSMMHQLRNIPAGELKVDRSFVLNLFESDGDRVMVEKTIEIGHELGMKVVAEGVESKEHLDFLASRGCDIAQGYYFSRAVPADQLISWLENFRQAGKPRANGTVFWIGQSSTSVHTEQSASMDLAESVFDTTYRKTEDERLPKDARRAHEILERTTYGVFVLDREWRFAYLNPSAELLLSNGHALRGENIWQCFPHAKDTKFGGLYRQTMLHRVPTEFQEFYPEPLNKWYEAHAYPIEEGISVFLRDITDALEIERTSRLHQQAIEAVPMGISIAEYSRESDFPLVYVNPAFERITGYTSSEVLGKNARLLQGDGTRESSRAEIGAAISEGRPMRVTLGNYRKDGTKFLNELQISAIRDTEGRATHLVGVQSDVTQQIAAREGLARQANFDALTGIPNRRHFSQKLQEAIGRAAQTDTCLAIVYVDVDNLKDVNDRLGHLAGDRLLVEVAGRIASQVRGPESTARIGGDEFAFFCDGCADTADMEGVLDRVRETLSTPMDLGGRELLVSASIGYAVYPTDARDSESLLRMADLAMYAAKNEGKNCWRAFSAGLDAGRNNRLQLVSCLRCALEKKEFFLVYQPRVDAITGQIRSLEALIRWNHPERGVMMPAQFITVAEEAGLIQEIGWWVIKEALQQYIVWQATGRKIVPISVKVSATQLRVPGFALTVIHHIEQAGLFPKSIELEFTESVLMDEAIRSGPIAALRDYGLRFTIDNFGSGGSLSSLARLPADTAKIDRSLTRSITEGGPEASICKAIIRLSKELKYTVVADGVESQIQAEVLRGWGCDQLQGSYFGRPMLAQEIETLR